LAGPFEKKKGRTGCPVDRKFFIGDHGGGSGKNVTRRKERLGLGQSEPTQFQLEERGENSTSYKKRNTWSKQNGGSGNYSCKKEKSRGVTKSEVVIQERRQKGTAKKRCPLITRKKKM